MLENYYSCRNSDFFFAKKYILLPSIEYKATLYASSRGYVTEIRAWIFTLSDQTSQTRASKSKQSCKNNQKVNIVLSKVKSTTLSYFSA